MENIKVKNKKIISRLTLTCLLVCLIVFAGIDIFLFLNSKNITAKSKIAKHYSLPADKNFYEQLYEFKKSNLNLISAPVAGVIPHHLLAGDLIANFFSNLDGFDYDTIILIGPNHFNAGVGKIISSAEDWSTPYGDLPVDKDALKELSLNKNISVEEDVFIKEHSIYSETAFIKKTFPKAKFLPLVLSPNLSSIEAENLAKEIFQLSKSKKILVLSSTDFSHYKTSAEAQADDKKSLEILANYSFDDVYKMAVDSPPATYVLLKYSNFFGANFLLLNNSNSALLANQPDIKSTTSYITGFFIKPEKNQAVLPETKISSLNFLFFGDLMLDRHVKEAMGAQGLSYLFSDLDQSGIFKGHDLVSANLEGAVTNEGAHYKPDNAYDFAFSPEVIGGLKNYGFNFFNIANNHLSDQGQVGILETASNLKNLNYDFSGCEDRKISDCSSVIIEKNNKKIGLIGASMVYGTVDEEALLAKVKKLKSEVDLVVVQMHWGTEYQHTPANNQIVLAHKLIDAGANMIIAHHPHVVSGIEIYKDKPIFYSLGNFVFDQYFSVDTQEELSTEIITDGNSFKIKLQPIQSKASQLRLMNEEEKDKFLEKLASWSIGDDKFKEEIKTGEIEIK